MILTIERSVVKKSMVNNDGSEVFRKEYTMFLRF